MVESLGESLGGVSGSWPVLLPELRNRLKLRREQLVERLTEALGVAGREEKVAYYYNQMEHGRLEPSGVSDRVLESLAAIVETTRDTLRRAGERVQPPAAGEEAVFARTAHADADYAAECAPASPAAEPSERSGRPRRGRPALPRRLSRRQRLPTAADSSPMRRRQRNDMTKVFGFAIRERDWPLAGLLASTAGAG